MPKLTQAKLKELLTYDPETGIFTWKSRTSNRIHIGDVAGNFSHGYITIRIYYQLYYAHRLAWLFIKGFIPKNIVIDHIDRNGINNKFTNLRLVSQSCNLKNCKLRKDNASGVTGVYFIDRIKKWTSCIYMDKHSVYLGNYTNFIDAVKARHEAEIEYNFPDCNITSSAYLYLKNMGKTSKKI